MKEEIGVRLISHTSELPSMTSKNFFHSVEFFRILEATPMQEPCMAVAEDKHGHVVAHMLTTIFYHRSFLPPAIYSHGRVYGEGEYRNQSERETIFPMFLEAVTSRFKHHLCLYIEFSHLSSKMLGYEAFKSCGYFPVPWQEIHNSLHGTAPVKRLTEKARLQIAMAERRGVTAIVVDDKKKIQQAVKLLKRHFMLKPRRSIPNPQMFQLLAESECCQIIAAEYHGKMIGMCLCLYTDGNAYMWHLASLRKSYMPLHPATFTVWAALNEAYNRGSRHMYFLDAGMPFNKSPLRDFIMSFGGKPVSKYRWFKLPFGWLNRMMDWIYNE